MSMDDKPVMPVFVGEPVVQELPQQVDDRVAYGVQVVSFDAEGEPAAIATIYIDASGRAQFSSKPGERTSIAASKSFGPLLTAAKKASVLIAQQGVRDAIQTKGEQS